jgi:hypothetical protein
MCMIQFVSSLKQSTELTIQMNKLILVECNIVKLITGSLYQQNLTVFHTCEFRLLLYMKCQVWTFTKCVMLELGSTSNLETKTHLVDLQS